jgi:hypothetical protein
MVHMEGQRIGEDALTMMAKEDRPQHRSGVKVVEE